ncbi:hypothetical protein CK203_103330 [Vitis vinifera]|uniref:Uncharacterized protein n=1 Tax=Vitis vinifera TaxID=29760 RepID=A0A438FB67_VITVI|nr:hypothetical protein CK203_103330 [Vitis vinifera]
MVCQMWIPVVPAAGLQVLKVWEVGAARQEVGGAREHHPDQVVPVETLMIQAIGLVNIALLPMSGPPLFARFASNGGKPHFHNTELLNRFVAKLEAFKWIVRVGFPSGQVAALIPCKNE